VLSFDWSTLQAKSSVCSSASGPISGRVGTIFHQL
jgi:hypothetical protein